jgi:hypothetical protein
MVPEARLTCPSYGQEMFHVFFTVHLPVHIQTLMILMITVTVLYLAIYCTNQMRNISADSVPIWWGIMILPTVLGSRTPYNYNHQPTIFYQLYIYTYICIYTIMYQYIYIFIYPYDPICLMVTTQKKPCRWSLSQLNHQPTGLSPAGFNLSGQPFSLNRPEKSDHLGGQGRLIAG